MWIAIIGSLFSLTLGVLIVLLGCTYGYEIGYRDAIRDLHKDRINRIL